jgi:ferritin-like metal-binding protein YciE
VKIQSLQDLFVDELRDLYNAENQLVKALPKMAKSANATDLPDAIEEHLEQTKNHVERLEQIFEKLDVSPKGKKCLGMQGLIAEGKEVLNEDMEENVLDAAVIAAAQRVEHYEMAGYGTARTFAKMLGQKEATQLLQETLNEESEANEKLTQLAESHINAEAAHSA